MVRPGTVAVRGRCRRSRWIGRQTHYGSSSSSSKLTPVREPRSVVPPAAFIFSVSLLRRCRHFFSSVSATSSSLSSSLVHSFVRSFDFAAAFRHRRCHSCRGQFTETAVRQAAPTARPSGDWPRIYACCHYRLVPGYSLSDNSLNAVCCWLPVGLPRGCGFVAYLPAAWLSHLLDSRLTRSLGLRLPRSPSAAQTHRSARCDGSINNAGAAGTGDCGIGRCTSTILCQQEQ